MRCRTILPSTLVCILLSTVAAGLVWMAGSSPVITRAREGYAKLRVGMSELEAESALGGPPALKDKLYGEWMADNHWYATSDPRNCPNPGPEKRLYDWYQWDFDVTSSWASESFYVGMLLEEGRVVCFWYGEEHENAAERGLKHVGRRLHIQTSFLSHRRSGDSHESARASARQ